MAMTPTFWCISIYKCGSSTQHSVSSMLTLMQGFFTTYQLLVKSVRINIILSKSDLWSPSLTTQFEVSKWFLYKTLHLIKANIWRNIQICQPNYPLWSYGLDMLNSDTCTEASTNTDPKQVTALSPQASATTIIHIQIFIHAILY